MSTAATKTAKEVLVVTADELTAIAELEKKFAEAKAKATKAENQLKSLRIALAEKVLGVKTADELKHLNPDQVEKRFQKRLTDGDWKLERGAPEFSFVKTSEGRYPAWAQLYAMKLGESAAESVRVSTATTYSYAVEVQV